MPAESSHTHFLLLFLSLYDSLSQKLRCGHFFLICILSIKLPQLISDQKKNVNNFKLVSDHTSFQMIPSPVLFNVSHSP